MKNICLLGSTGYIGVNALDVIKGKPGLYNVTSLGAGVNIDLLLSQIKEFKPKYAAVINFKLAEELKKKLGNFTNTKIVWGNEGYSEIATLPEIDLVIGAMSGFSGLTPIYSAVTASKDIALANKESLVIAGPLLMSESKKRGVKIFPIDSEHSAIQQSIQGHSRKDIRKIILTGSGGPFRNFPADRLAKVKPEEALKHPNWNMGMKITIDSATLMNKGLEAIEARWLFNLQMNQIEIIIHPQSIIHSMVEYMDGSIMAQLSDTDMRIPIAYALSYPRHLKGNTKPLNFLDVGNLSFEKPDIEKFRCLGLALNADKAGGSMMPVLNGANEIAVNAFLQRKIGFVEIPELIERTMENHEIFTIDSIDKAIEANQWARSTAKQILNTRW
ncbi:MAG: 1-deoxy-D-xylulose-5-phosphate reductoisomerase [Deltaproteobacteria bacterium]|nr:1-deoxy-D-xylulose-5-phosphate reductoisomerase [Deltaproteobacteria bacterium]